MATTNEAETSGFWGDLNASKLLNFGLTAFSEQTKQDAAAATKAEADAKTRLYEASVQKQAPATAASMPFNMTYALIGGGVLIGAIMLLKK